MTTTSRRYYSDMGLEFLSRAQTYLAEDDLRQASEKGWGAAAQMVKGVAQTRGWPHNSHHHLFRAIERLADEADDEQLRTLFHAANSLHINYYEGWMERGMVANGLTEVATLVEKLDPLSTA